MTEKKYATAASHTHTQKRRTLSAFMRVQASGSSRCRTVDSYFRVCWTYTLSLSLWDLFWATLQYLMPICFFLWYIPCLYSFILLFLGFFFLFFSISLLRSCLRPPLFHCLFRPFLDPPFRVLLSTPYCNRLTLWRRKWIASVSTVRRWESNHPRFDSQLHQNPPHIISMMLFRAEQITLELSILDISHSGRSLPLRVMYRTALENQKRKIWMENIIVQ